MTRSPVVKPGKSAKKATHVKDSEAVTATGGTNSVNAILMAAVEEFSERGFEGARMEAVAQRAGYNKSLVYRHFTDKRGLFEAVLRHKIEQRTDMAHRMPDELAAALEYWFEQTFADPYYLRLLIREARRADLLADECPEGLELRNGHELNAGIGNRVLRRLCRIG